MFRSVLDALKVVCGGRRKPLSRNPLPKARSTGRLVLESLEDRCLLSLSPVVNYPVISGPQDAVAGDFNGDSVLDLATINTSQLSILIGNGDGTFDAAQTSTFGAGLRGLAAADFNGDGSIDLVTSSTVTTWNGSTYVTQANVNIHLNNGTDSTGQVLFQTARSFSTGTNLNPGAIAVGDLNGDGSLDVATVHVNGNSVTVLLGNGDGTLRTAQNFAVGSTPNAIVIKDVNKDQKLDIVTANEGSDDVTVLVNDSNTSTGNFSFKPASSFAVEGDVVSVAVGDLDADGNMDLIATSNILASEYWGYWGAYFDYDGQVNVLLGDGQGGFSEPLETWANSNEIGDVDTADFNGDGILDVIVADDIVRPMIDPTVLLGHGDGAFESPYHFFADYGPGTLVIEDFNDDDATDVATANLYSTTVSVLLNANDWPPIGAPFVSVTGATFLEGNDGSSIVEIAVTLSDTFSQSITVDYATSNYSALAGLDYEASSGTLTIAANQPGGVIQLRILGDRTFEADESFLVTLSNPTNARLAGSQAWVGIRDDEPRISIADTRIVEGNDGTTKALFTLSLATAYDEDVSVSFATADGNALAGSDYVAASGTGTVKAGDTTATIEVTINGDRVGEQTEVQVYDPYYGYYYDPYYGYYDYSYGYYYTTYEDYESFTVNISNASAGTITDSQATGFIDDDEARISITGASVKEGNDGVRLATFTVTVTDYDIPVTIGYSTADATALAGSDYVAQSDILIFDPTGPRTQEITVQILGDRSVEEHEYFVINLDSVSAGLVVSDQASISIVDDEPRISISGPATYFYDSSYGYYYGAVEGNDGPTSVTFTVTVSEYDAPVMVTYSTANGTATAGSDYDAQKGTLVFNPTDPRTQTITIQVIGDRVVEENESFQVKIDSVNTGLITNAQASATIGDDEPRAYISSGYVYEGNSGTIDMVFYVTLDRAYDEAITMTFSTRDATAKAGSDYQALTKTLTFAPGQTYMQVVVKVIGDTTKEENEGFIGELSGGSGSVGYNNSSAWATIYNDDGSLTGNGANGNKGGKRR